MTVSGTLKFFRRPVMEDIRHTLESTNSVDDFLAYIDQLSESPASFHELEWEFGSDIPELNHVSDIHSAIALHKYLGMMTPVQASDRRLWTWLSCVQFREYTKTRWPLGGSGWKNRIRDRWMVARSNREALTRNSLGRLWRAADIVFDPTLSQPLSRVHEDPYAYVWPLLQKQDRFVSLMERDISSNPKVLFPLLDRFHQLGDNASETFVREMMKEMILITGYRELGTLDLPQISREVENVSNLVVERLE